MAETKEDVKDSKGNVIARDVPVTILDPAPFDASTVFGSYNKDKDAQFAVAETALANGHLIREDYTVEYTKKDGDKIVGIFRQVVPRLVAKNKQGALALPNIAGDEATLWSAATDFGFRNTKQNAYMSCKNASAGPEKALEKIQKALASLSPEQREAALTALGMK